MKIGFFSDPHCGSDEVNCGVRHPALGLARMQEVLCSFRARGVGLCVCCGDLIDGENGPAESADYLKRTSQLLRESKIPFACLPGNHDLYCMDHRSYYRETGFETLPRTVSADGVTLVFLDACYTEDGKPYFSSGFKSDWKNTFLPDDQLDYLRGILAGASSDARFWIVTHQCLDPDIERGHRIRNSEKVREILREHGNGRVEKCICGHYHRGGNNLCDGIGYITIHALCTDDEIRPGSVVILDTDR